LTIVKSKTGQDDVLTCFVNSPELASQV